MFPDHDGHEIGDGHLGEWGEYGPFDMFQLLAVQSPPCIFIFKCGYYEYSMPD